MLPPTRWVSASASTVTTCGVWFSGRLAAAGSSESARARQPDRPRVVPEVVEHRRAQVGGRRGGLHLEHIRGMPGEPEPAVLRVPHEPHVRRPDCDVREVPRLPVHEAVTCRGGRADHDRRRSHDHAGRKGERRQPPGAEAREQDERAAEDRRAHRDPARRAEQGRRPTGSQQEHERGRDRLPRRHEQRDAEREDEDAREHELVHRHMHAWVEREVGAVEVVEPVPEARPEPRERVREAEGTAWAGRGATERDRRQPRCALRRRSRPRPRRRASSGRAGGRRRARAGGARTRSAGTPRAARGAATPARRRRAQEH